ncbi:hypothetical protein LTS14_008096 [Recurvomyces mirabilis]|uniref:uncharacterized protein n=1 Tax=Recurvomyces mirabilis TaxID=574656 RepID=UPI002DDE66EC|nr:hypothetical protein LTS14_008096 [Recurvomyces mirabilis]
MVRKIELRVHAGAPSGHNDDGRYRRLAHAYAEHNGWTEIQTPSAEIANEPYDSGAAIATSKLIAGQSENVAIDDETAYLDDTQLAYNALESQLLTSSLDLHEEITPRRTPHVPAAESPWPDDLARHSPVAEPSLTANDALSEQISSPPSRPHVGVIRPASRSADTAIFKPFKLPIKRKPVSDDDGQEIPKQIARPGVHHMKTPSVNARRQEFSGHETSLIEYTAVRDDEGISKNAEGKNEDHEVLVRSPTMADYREHTPKPQLTMPFVPLREGDQTGLAYIGNLGAPQTVTPLRMPHQSQLSGSGQESTSELPTSYSLSDITSESSRARLRNSQRSTSDPGPITVSSAASNSAGSVRSASQPAQPASGSLLKSPKTPSGQHECYRQDKENRTGAAGVLALTVDARPASGERSDSSPDHSEIVQAMGRCDGLDVLEARQAEESRASILDDLSASVRPPAPMTALAKFDTHVTASLKYLADHPTMANCYKPASVQRDLRPMERGYWLIPTLEWPAEKQLKFWEYLISFIGDGQAGWGVWCVRERSQQPLVTTTIGTVKVYCWGEVVKHIYLMLYVASESKVRKLGLQWFDSEDSKVIQMREVASRT